MRSFYAAAALLPLALAVPTVPPSFNGKYIVVLKPSASVASLQSILGGGLLQSVPTHHVYNFGTFKGFAVSLNASHITALQSDSNVAYIEPDGLATTQTVVDEAGAPWGLGRISHSTSGATDYAYDDSAGAGSCAYVIDTGVDGTHPDFEGRATLIKSFTGVNSDDNGHGTHVSGTIASKTYGVAKSALVFGIKVLDAQGSGEWSTIVSGIQLAVTDSASRAASCPNGFVVNMSLGGGLQQSVNDAVAAAVGSGLFFAVAAGNDGVDFKSTSPASEPKAFAVGASDSTDGLAYFSNYGATLGVIAPGVDVLSTWPGGGTNNDSGTSMATPHVVGLAAYLLGMSGPMSPAALKAKIQGLALRGAITMSSSANSTPNLLAYNGVSA